MQKVLAPAITSLLLVFVQPFAGFAQTSIPDANPVLQNFNSIGTTATASLPANWKMP